MSSFRAPRSFQTSVLLAAICLLMISQGIHAQTTDTTKYGAKCKVDLDCSPPNIICENKVCVRKALFPMTGKEIGGIFVLLFLTVIAVIVGLSGGLVIVPTIVIMLDFSAKQAVVMANFIILLTSITKYILGLFKTNPEASFKTIINYNMVIAMVPWITLFSTIGGIVTAFVPDVLVIFLLASVVAYSTTSAIVMIRRLYLKRKQQKRVIPQNGQSEVPIQPFPVRTENPIETESPILSTDRNLQETNPEQKNEVSSPHLDSPLTKQHELVVVANSIHATTEPEFKESELTTFRNVPKSDVKELTEAEKLKNKILLENLKKVEGTNFYWKKFGVAIFVIAVSILASLFRGGSGVNSIIGVKRCSSEDWGIFSAYILCLVFLPVYCYLVVFKEQKIKAEIKYDLDPHEVLFSNKSFGATVLYSGFTGVLSTITGNGGGAILNPWFTWMKYMPITASWTINFLVVISKIAAVLVAIIGGQIIYSYVFFYGILVAVLIIIMENTLLVVVKKMKSQIVMPIGMILVLLVSLSMNLYLGISTWVDKAKAGKPTWVFSSYC